MAFCSEFCHYFLVYKFKNSHMNIWVFPFVRFLCLWHFLHFPMFFFAFITCLYDLDALKPHFYIINVGFTGGGGGGEGDIIFHISAQNIDCRYSFEPPHRGGSDLTSTHYVLSRNMGNIRFFYLKIFLFWVVKFSIYLNRRVLELIWDETWAATYLQICAPNADTNQPAHPRNLIRVFVIRMKKLHSWFPKCAHRRIWSEWANAQADIRVLFAR